MSSQVGGSLNSRRISRNAFREKGSITGSQLASGRSKRVVRMVWVQLIKLLETNASHNVGFRRTSDGRHLWRNSVVCCQQSGNYPDAQKVSECTSRTDSVASRFFGERHQGRSYRVGHGHTRLFYWSSRGTVSRHPLIPPRAYLRPQALHPNMTTCLPLCPCPSKICAA